jgi:hypothetical protein
VAAGAQALGLAAFAVAVVVHGLGGDRSSTADFWLLAALLLLWAAGLAWAARGVWRARRWSRAPLVLSQLLLLAVGVPLVQGEGARWAGVLMVATSLTGLVAVLTPRVTAALE